MARIISFRVIYALSIYLNLSIHRKNGCNCGVPEFYGARGMATRSSRHGAETGQGAVYVEAVSEGIERYVV